MLSLEGFFPAFYRLATLNLVLSYKIKLIIGKFFLMSP